MLQKVYQVLPHAKDCILIDVEKDLNKFTFRKVFKTFQNWLFFYVRAPGDESVYWDAHGEQLLKDLISSYLK